MTRPAVPTVFLDRDGVINVPTGRPHAYVTRWEDFEFLSGVAGAIRRLNGAGYRVVVATNQRGVARGAMTQERLDDIHARMVGRLREQGARIDAVYACPHEGGCACRKPGIGLLEQANRDAPVDKTRSLMVGDSLSDMLAARAFGIAGIYVGDDPKTLNDGADYVCGGLPEAVALILGGAQPDGTSPACAQRPSGAADSTRKGSAQ